MVLEGQNASYEIIQTLPESGGNVHYRCRRMDTGEMFHLAGAPVGGEILSLVAQWQDNPAFADFKSYLIWDNRIYLVFPDVSESVLGDSLESMTALQRFAAGQQVMEQFLIQDMPLCLQWELADTGAVYLEEEAAGVHFFYLREPVEAYAGVTRKMVCKRLFQFFEALFSEEIREEYPETDEFLRTAGDYETAELMDLYVKYLELLPVFSRVPEKTEKEKGVFWKTYGKKLLSAFQVALGVMTLCAALILLPEVWNEKIKPLVDGAALWKSVYVDGETLPGETESEESTEASEPEAEEADSQRETRYWENGEVRYQGGMLDEKYEGTGTLYYADGCMEYQGEFAFGKREGTGIAYTEKGQMLYEGQFHNDRYEGEGRLYDEEYGSLVYEGGFRSGKYSGEGTLYQPLSDFLVYVGGFRLGHYDGSGVEYDENGCMRYEGDFLLGVYHGNGTMYDPDTGIILFTGAFRNGMPVLTDELDGELNDEMTDELGGELNGELNGELGGELNGELNDELGGGLNGELGDELDGKPKDELGDELNDKPKDAPDSTGKKEDAPDSEDDSGQQADEKSPVIGPVGAAREASGGGPGVN